MSYRQVLNGIAMSQLAVSPNIPDFHLMVGSAECLEPLPILVYEHASVPNEVVENMKTVNNMTNEQIEKAIENNQLEVNDMNWNLATLGSGI